MADLLGGGLALTGIFQQLGILREPKGQQNVAQVGAEPRGPWKGLVLPPSQQLEKEDEPAALEGVGQRGHPRLQAGDQGGGEEGAVGDAESGCRDLIPGLLPSRQRGLGDGGEGLHGEGGGALNQRQAKAEQGEGRQMMLTVVDLPAHEALPRWLLLVPRCTSDPGASCPLASMVHPRYWMVDDTWISFPAMETEGEGEPGGKKQHSRWHLAGLKCKQWTTAKEHRTSSSFCKVRGSEHATTISSAYTTTRQPLDKRMEGNRGEPGEGEDTEDWRTEDWRTG